MDLRLAAAFGASAAVHLLIFLLFIVVSSEKVSSPRPAPELLLLSRDIPEHRPLLDALESESPTQTLSHRLLPADSALNTPPRFFLARSDLRPLPLPKNPGAKPVAVTDLPSPPAQQQPPPASFLGSLQLSPNLQARLLPPPPIPRAPTPQLLEPASFLVGISSGGECGFLLLQKSSGDGNADRAAESFLRSLPFSKAPQAPPSAWEWGQITLQWASPTR
ncbi:MAG: hypothetical protein RLZZ244_882 [Verrucomicrobiota bacterium]|jgi:hypothetical protein